MSQLITGLVNEQLKLVELGAKVLLLYVDAKAWSLIF